MVDGQAGSLLQQEGVLVGRRRPAAAPSTAAGARLRTPGAPRRNRLSQTRADQHRRDSCTHNREVDHSPADAVPQRTPTWPQRSNSSGIKRASGMSSASVTAVADTRAGSAAPVMRYLRAAAQHTPHGAGRGSDGADLIRVGIAVDPSSTACLSVPAAD